VFVCERERNSLRRVFFSSKISHPSLRIQSCTNWTTALVACVPHHPPRDVVADVRMRPPPAPPPASVSIIIIFLANLCLTMLRHTGCRAMMVEQRFQAAMARIVRELRPTHFLVGVSGGCDSVALLHLLRHWAVDVLHLYRRHHQHHPPSSGRCISIIGNVA
jgi:hypothetical protein